MMMHIASERVSERTTEILHFGRNVLREDGTKKSGNLFIVVFLFSAHQENAFLFCVENINYPQGEKVEVRKKRGVDGGSIDF